MFLKTRYPAYYLLSSKNAAYLQGLNNNVIQLHAPTNHSGKNKSFTGDIHSTQVVARIWLCVAKLLCSAHLHCTITQM